MEILLAFAFAIGLNLLMFIPAFYFKTDKLTDISYAVTFAALAVFGFLRSESDTLHFILLTMVLLWAFRLGGYLLYRVTKKGKDSRFDGKREDFNYFLRFWFLQGLTVAVVMLPSLFAMDSKANGLGWLSWVGLIIFSAGLVLETVADLQKDRFNSNSKNKGKWIEEGVWSWSRHPNYLGEIMVWVGVYIFTAPVLGATALVVGLASPIYITVLLTKGSGIPILEKYADEKWGDDPKYQEYKERVGVLLPKF